jgi:dienelactone hydrolase
MKRPLLLAVLVLSLCLPSMLPAQVAEEAAKDARLGKPKDYNGFFPWTPPTSKEAWEKRRQEVREQVLIANGLWPMPQKTPLKAVIHGKIERDGYTIEKVYFASYPGHYVTGNLYRPTGKKGKLPAILSPHGHWANGRFYDAGEKNADAQIKQGAEKTIESARYPLQARCAQLARLGCVVFFYDMVGYADSKQIAHRAGFTDPAAELWLQSFMGLQTWNSVRALDFLVGLPDVDSKRIGVTGASGGGTQTFILAAVDDRPAAAFPAVMVSMNMQGGCICENCSYLRVGTGNIELAGLFAPKPLGMAAAKDWTHDIEQNGLPQLKELYRLYGAEDNVMAKAYLQFGHNYNQVSRELMYNFFNKHLKLGHPEPIVEQPFVPVPPTELSVWNDQHQLPKDAVDAKGLREQMTQESRAQIDSLLSRSTKDLSEFRRIIGLALRVLITDTLPAADEVQLVGKLSKEEKDGLILHKALLTRKGQQEAIPSVGVLSKDFNGTVVVWIHPKGIASLWEDGKLVPAARELVNKKAAVLAVDVFGTGALTGAPTPVNKNYAGYTFGYNRPLLANRVHDILTAVAMAKKLGKTVHLVGFDKAGPWVALARGLCGDAVTRTAADLDGFRFDQIRMMDDDMMLPGALKYGGLPVLTGLSAPHELYVHNTRGTAADDVLVNLYEAAGAAKNVRRQEERASAARVVEWLLR